MGSPIPLYEPTESGNQDGVFISRSYDATSHFETTTGEFNLPLSWVSSSTVLMCYADDVRDIYRRAEKKELVVEGLREGESLAAE